MSETLTGKNALVTGATSGIGRATAQVLAGQGAHVVVSGRDTSRGEKAVAEIRAAGGKADFVRADLNGAAGARELARAATRITGGIDILVNNAGIYPFVATGDTSEEVFDEVYDVNVKGPFFLTAELIPAMAAKGAGLVVNIGTVAARKGITGATAYTSSKAAVDQLTRIWAAEYGPSGVRVNAVLPGIIETEGVQTALGDERGPFLAITPAGRVGRPEEIAAAVAYLASDSAAFVNGAFLTVDGGASAL
ncbi:SDR family NAD(P)-dependent oxidoreductase [Actinomadura sp. DC4]|uniref:SDR family NAD(P)-dependent oxidoreductase n=1 Tax=Actinomadura sp. DC4 TaxID=3055069 RepID=UPI0025B22D7A|nr:SDR family NAD(P)-dependent oxidoreductase [Actinomadura sp. DC4]MDN3354796.1 SDR family NAD(P)-dependent oxidoreductase [Actinomadura sp. DC4]